MTIKITKLKKVKKVSKASKAKSRSKRNPKNLKVEVDENFHNLIQAVNGINNFFYLDYINNSNRYDVTNDIPDLEDDLKTLTIKVSKVQNESQKTKLYGKLPNIGEYEIAALGKLKQLNSIHDMGRISMYIKRIVLILTEFKRKQFIVSNKNYQLLEKEIFDLYDEVKSYFIDANVSWM